MSNDLDGDVEQSRRRGHPDRLALDRGRRPADRKRAQELREARQLEQSGLW